VDDANTELAFGRSAVNTRMRFPYERSDPSLTPTSWPLRVLIFVAVVLVLIGSVLLARDHIAAAWLYVWTVDGFALVLILTGLTLGAIVAIVRYVSSTAEPEPLVESSSADTLGLPEEADRLTNVRIVWLNQLHRYDAAQYFEMADRAFPALPEKLTEAAQTELRKRADRKRKEQEASDEAMVKAFTDGTVTTSADNELESDDSKQPESTTVASDDANELRHRLRALIQPKRRVVFVLRFDGDMRASQVSFLRKMVNLLVQIATPHDEVVLRLTSPGGLVAEYGLASAQLLRLKSAKIPLTVCVDTVAASGGYLMAAVADRIVASPFAFIGSIGVMAVVPNFHTKLKKNDVDVYEFTAGQFKSPVSVVGPITDQGKAKFQESLEDIHEAFQGLIATYRPQVDVHKVSTGEVWLATDARALGLVDAVMTSDEYLHSRFASHQVFELRKPRPKKTSLLGQLRSYVFGFANRFAKAGVDAMTGLWSGSSATSLLAHATTSGTHSIGHAVGMQAPVMRAM